MAGTWLPLQHTQQLLAQLLPSLQLPSLAEPTDAQQHTHKPAEHAIIVHQSAYDMLKMLKLHCMLRMLTNLVLKLMPEMPFHSGMTLLYPSSGWWTLQ